jgi:hypothetical protein
VPAQVNSVGVDVAVTREEVGRGDHVVDFAQKAFFFAGVVVAAAQRREHHHNA